mmetsp:Transcript_70559/g.200263  ORF Transcript_70559/g.200263 Transcript_70559/m.200263 type:complete len:284 (+) Transcript_70559:746-1597(+)
MAHPAWTPKLRSTWLFSRRCRIIPGCLWYSARSGLLWSAPSIVAKATTDISALRLLSCSSSLLLIRHTIRKLSPLLRFGAPWNSFATPWTISAMWFTKVVMLVCSTSVDKLKLFTLATPITQSTCAPGTMASTRAVCSFACRLWAMMLQPAWPKPITSSVPSLMMVFSRMTVSMMVWPSCWPWKTFKVTRSFRYDLIFSRFLLLSRALARSSARNSSSDILMAAMGLSRMVSTRCIMFSSGWTTKLFASWENRTDPINSRQSTKKVVHRPSQDSSCTNFLRSK